jgi:hypothetical protein
VKHWSNPTHPPTPTIPIPPTPLSSISHLILLDLLGAPNPSLHSFYPQTGWLYDEFLHSEAVLRAAGALWPESVKGGGEQSFFVTRDTAVYWGGSIEDDHLPFVERGVPVVHLIAAPFPSVWHTNGVSPILKIHHQSSCTDWGLGAGRRLSTRPPYDSSLVLDPPSDTLRVPRTRSTQLYRIRHCSSVRTGASHLVAGDVSTRLTVWG